MQQQKISSEAQLRNIISALIKGIESGAINTQEQINLYLKKAALVALELPNGNWEGENTAGETVNLRDFLIGITNAAETAAKENVGLNSNDPKGSLARTTLRILKGYELYLYPERYLPSYLFDLLKKEYAELDNLQKVIEKVMSVPENQGKKLEEIEFESYEDDVGKNILEILDRRGDDDRKKQFVQYILDNNDNGQGFFARILRKRNVEVAKLVLTNYHFNDNNYKYQARLFLLVKEAQEVQLKVKEEIEAKKSEYEKLEEQDHLKSDILTNQLESVKARLLILKRDLDAKSYSKYLKDVINFCFRKIAQGEYINIEILKMLAAATGIEINEFKFRKGLNLLGAAIYGGNQQMIKELMASGKFSLLASVAPVYALIKTKEQIIEILKMQAAKAGIKTNGLTFRTGLNLLGAAIIYDGDQQMIQGVLGASKGLSLLTSSVASIQALINPADRERIMKVLNEAFKSCPREAIEHKQEMANLLAAAVRKKDIVTIKSILALERGSDLVFVKEDRVSVTPMEQAMILLTSEINKVKELESALKTLQEQIHLPIIGGADRGRNGPTDAEEQSEASLIKEIDQHNQAIKLIQDMIEVMALSVGCFKYENQEGLDDLKKKTTAAREAKKTKTEVKPEDEPHSYKYSFLANQLKKIFDKYKMDPKLKNPNNGGEVSLEAWFISQGYYKAGEILGVRVREALEQIKKIDPQVLNTMGVWSTPEKKQSPGIFESIRTWIGIIFNLTPPAPLSLQEIAIQTAGVIEQKLTNDISSVNGLVSLKDRGQQYEKYKMLWLAHYLKSLNPEDPAENLLRQMLINKFEARIKRALGVKLEDDLTAAIKSEAILSPLPDFSIDLYDARNPINGVKPVQPDHEVSKLKDQNPEEPFPPEPDQDAPQPPKGAPIAATANPRPSLKEGVDAQFFPRAPQKDQSANPAQPIPVDELLVDELEVPSFPAPNPPK